jgi:hypothetical protein
MTLPYIAVEPTERPSEKVAAETITATTNYTIISGTTAFGQDAGLRSHDRWIGGVEDYQLALATYRAACERWPGAPITLRQGARVIEDSRRTRTALWSGKGSREGGR